MMNKDEEEGRRTKGEDHDRTAGAGF